MAQYYPYLISSLPALMFGSQPPFPFARLLQLCEGFIEDGDMRLVRFVSRPVEIFTYAGKNGTLLAWREFEAALRNEIVRIRANRGRRDPSRYLRPDDGFSDPALSAAALRAHRHPSLLESERLLDEARWRKLDELAIGHYFDIDALIIYALKLTVLLRWEAIRTADRIGLLAQALSQAH